MPYTVAGLAKANLDVLLRKAHRRPGDADYKASIGFEKRRNLAPTNRQLLSRSCCALSGEVTPILPRKTERIDPV